MLRTKRTKQETQTPFRLSIVCNRRVRRIHKQLIIWEVHSQHGLSLGTRQQQLRDLTPQFTHTHTNKRA